MTTLQSPHKKALNAPSYDGAFIWWYQPLMATNSSSVKLQYIWFDTLNDAMRHELELFSTMVDSYSKLTNCMLGLEGVQTPLSMVSCYHNIASDMADVNMRRILKVTELKEDFKERLWSEM
ncbi:hypothetical protein J7J47_19090 [Halomonas sp. ISL-60]|uniref:hypothetical protein n=1 Tax=Halomonas sp. ISL-56 TaxID=2819149 RepID=UPI001BE9F146|nr:hypothetical protein [Halomonas sp. ISL-56]MBT2774337.1 hypothetical protein [Halomonas sp. ISL-60]MBT2799906.1 hypothetical protein [Halomonas sp. ISL-56]